MVKLYPKNIKAAITALNHMLDNHIEDKKLSENQVERIYIAISNLEEYLEEMEFQKERKKYLTK